MKNIFKKFFVLFGLSFVLFGFNYIFAEEIPVPLVCVDPQILNEEGICADPITEPEPLVCTEPQILNETGDECIDPVPEIITCIESQILVDGICTNPIIEPTPDPVVENIIQNVIVKNGCVVKDTEGIEHIFPEENSVSEFLGVCALVSAKDAGYINEFELTNDSNFGLYLSSINGEIPSSTEYWALFLNDGYASCGIGCLPVLINDTLSFVLSDWMAGTESTKISLKISSLEDITPDPVPENNSGTGGGSSGGSISKSFSVPDAISFLSSQQKSDGSFGDLLYTDWAAIAISRGDNSNLKSSVKDYIKNTQVNSSVITDFERHAMALMSLGINPYNGTSVDYIKKITDSFDGTQIGDNSLFNDDIFGIIVLQNAGYDDNDEIITDTILYIISKQSGNGSWGSVDMTSAGIMALENFKNVDGVSDAIGKAENYLTNSQKSDGGFDNSFSTSWATQALSLNSSYDNEVKNAIQYLADKQQSDGGLDGSDINNRIWATSYAIPAVLKLSWTDILESFEKEEEEETSNNNSQSGNTTSNNENTPIIILATPEEKETIPTVSEVKVEQKIAKIYVPQKEEIIQQEIKKDIIEDTNLINNNDLLASAGNIDVNNPNKNKIIIITIVSVFVISIGWWLTRRYIL